ncbi:lysozyme family protein (plasmid) [Thalassospira sp. SM2505]
MSKFRHIAIGIVAYTLGVGSVSANPQYSADCLVSAQEVTHNLNDYRLLSSLLLVESGLTKREYKRPQAWAINYKGESYYFSDFVNAKKFALGLISEGQENFDIGCAQINYRWWNHHFESIDDMLDPRQNVRFAFALLKTHIRNTGSVVEGVARYHIRGDSPEARKKARQYACRVFSEYYALSGLRRPLCH